MGEPTYERRFSVACRAITKGDKVVEPGHGGRWADSENAGCPRCGRKMTLTGEVRAVVIGRDDA